MPNLTELAIKHGFHNASIIEVEQLTFIPEYRKFCEDNLCGQFGKNPSCPPASGTVEEMAANCRKYSKALVLQLISECSPSDDMATKAEKHRMNLMTEDLIKAMAKEGFSDTLMMSAGPFKDNSCMSAYCVDAQKIADAAGIQCWVDDGKCRFFTLVLFDRHATESPC